MPPLYDPRHYDRDRPVGSYWEATGGADPALHPLGADLAADVAIIGGGYTGLAAAYHLAKLHGLRAAVLEAGPIGWGASGRNGGFCGLGGTKLDYGAMADRFGPGPARAYFAAQKAGVGLVRDLARGEGIDIEACGEGEHYVAHKPNRVPALRAKAELVRRLFGERWPVWSREELAERLLDAPEAHGCLHVPHYFGLHPLRYVRGLAAAASAAGASVHPRSPVLRWERSGGRHRLHAPAATVTASRVLVATNGYTPEELDPASLAGRVLPALSSIIVTRPLTPAEQAAHRWTRPALLADTRDLLFYIRLLPDGRLLFGARGGTDASPAAFEGRKAWMLRRLAEKFPAWAGAEVEHAWWGLVCLARDLLPHLSWLDGDDGDRTTLAALAYHGGGVAFATMLGRAAAAVLAGREPDPPLPAFVRTAPPRFPLPAARVWALRGAYVAYRVADEWR
jgi:glycine/D-amino acid oxidase-like deaminating enzyme